MNVDRFRRIEQAAHEIDRELSRESTEKDALRETLAEVITEALALYTLPANYAQPLTPLGPQTHDDVARRCGPMIADQIMERLFPPGGESRG